ncbi:ABC transporter permease [Mesorhizobium sp.]|uniref:ABC transporter permease n=1 Tax=Mesorhizobium sp. TaxID=1871066 RepID=UPI001221F207|nr:ABC transporter permease [Mesorhizobium sp.]TIO65368.1 MAG: ABC transporter permease [Mesorhizobium sp.]
MNNLTMMILKRLAFGVLTLFVISGLIFLAVQALPGDLTQAILGRSATPETVAAFRRELGLDLPPYIRYFEWISGILKGDLGTSLANNRPIIELLETRLYNTLFLACAAALISIPIAIGLGMLAALYRQSLLDKLISISTLSMISFPEYFVAYILIALLSVTFPVFPSLASVSPDMGLWDRLYAIALPVLTLTFVVTAHMMRMTRAAIINVLGSPYIEMARLKGIKKGRVILHHALPNSLSPIINVVVLNLTYLVGGVVLIEVVFVYPGLGQLLVDSVSKRDVPVVQAISLIFAAVFVLLILAADILAILANPKHRHPK